MNRQKIRKTLIFISFLLFPVTIYYFSPILIIQGASEGVIVGSFITFTVLFIISLVLARGFCGWACPAAGLQRLCFMVNDKPARGGRFNWIKYGIWVPWLSLIAITAISAGGFHSVEPFYQTFNGISVHNLQSLVILLIFVGLIAALSLTLGRRAFCHYGCWMAPFMIVGTKIKDSIGWPSLHLRADREKCINCKTCSKSCPMSLDVNGMVQKGSMKNSECILCGTCVDGCPEGVISYSFERYR